MQPRTIVEVIQARATKDGDGVNLSRVFGGSGLERFDPFLMLDDFSSDNPADYIAGFPPHPHRGFRTITYMQQGHFEHQDHMGNVGVIRDGGAQWMTAGRGVIHSEMPKQSDGRLRGFQLWLNLPAKDKMIAPDYQNIEAEQIATSTLDGVTIRAIAGSGQVNAKPVPSHYQVADTQPQIWFISNTQPQQQRINITQANGRTALIYIAKGTVSVPTSHWQGSQGQLVRFSDSGDIALQLHVDAEIMLLTGKPLHEPIVQYGPFVMNSQDQIDQAVADYQSGHFAELPA